MDIRVSESISRSDVFDAPVEALEELVRALKRTPQGAEMLRTLILQLAREDVFAGTIGPRSSNSSRGKANHN
jgi:hypothetical protein